MKIGGRDIRPEFNCPYPFDAVGALRAHQADMSSILWEGLREDGSQLVKWHGAFAHFRLKMTTWLDIAHQLPYAAYIGALGVCVFEFRDRWDDL